MKTKNIFNMLAFAMLMPTMLLTTACSNDDDIVNNNENTFKKGYAMPFEVNVTREGNDATTRAYFNETSKKLEFTAGDKLFVRGKQSEAGSFAGTLDYVSPNHFSGILYTEKSTTRPVVEVVALANSERKVPLSDSFVEAVLLPKDYAQYKFIEIADEGSYQANLSYDYTKVFALTRAEAIEQFSREMSTEYSSGFALHPQNAILEFQISKLTKEYKVPVKVTASYEQVVEDVVTTNASGVATFYSATADETSENLALKVGGIPFSGGEQSIDLSDITGSNNKPLTAGHTYSIKRNATTATPKNLVVANVNVGDIVCTDEKAYAVTDRFFLPTDVIPLAVVAHKAVPSYAVALKDCPNAVNWDGVTDAIAAFEPKLYSHPWQFLFWDSIWQYNLLNDSGTACNVINSYLKAAGGDELTNYGDYWAQATTPGTYYSFRVANSSVTLTSLPDKGNEYLIRPGIFIWE